MKSLIEKREIALFTDLYQLTMAQIYFNKGMNDTAVFDFFIRPNDKRAYFVMAGLQEFKDVIDSFRFSKESIDYLASTKKFTDEFLEYLQNFQFNGEILAVPEGHIVFANEPICSVRAPLIEAQLIETILINTLQLPIMIATKAARCVSVAKGTKIVDFGLRRAQGLDSGLKAARASYIAGFLGTSNVLAGKKYGIPIFGTMAHSYILAHENEEEAFEDFIRQYPKNAILLVDTFDTIKGVQKAIKTAQKMGIEIKGIRLDSGDIVSLAKEARKMLDNAGLKETIILVSGGLSEYKIAQILSQGAPVDAWGVGTELVVSADMPYLDCAYKLSEYAGKPKMKLSEHKVTLPGKKQIWRAKQEIDDIIDLEDAKYPDRAGLLQPFFDQKFNEELFDLNLAKERFMQDFQMLPKQLKALEPETIYLPKIGEALDHLTQRLKKELLSSP